MPFRTIEVDGATWKVFPSGYRTQYSEDEFGVFFERGEGEKREIRVTRYSPLGSRSPGQSFAELDDERLRELLAQSQPSFTSPEAGYRK